MTQKDFFKKANTDHLLKLRYTLYLGYPVNEGDKPDYEDEYGVKSYVLDNTLLKSELSTRPHRVRAKDRRKNKSK